MFLISDKNSFIPIFSHKGGINTGDRRKVDRCYHQLTSGQEFNQSIFGDALNS